MTKYTVIFRTLSGRISQTTCVVTEGYSTLADIPKMISIKHGEGCEILAMMKEGLSTGARTAVVAAFASAK